MIRTLLSSFRTYPEKYCKLSETGNKNLFINTNINYYYSNKFLMIFTVVWIMLQSYNFTFLSLRPGELFNQITWFGKIFMPFFPSVTLFYSIVSLAIVLVFVIMFFKENTILKIMLSFAIMWINIFPWSFGGQGHPGHLLILSHLLSIFIIASIIKFNPTHRDISRSIEWLYLGLFSTYFFSGFLKLLALIYKLILKPNEISWISPKAALFNCLFGYLNSDMPYEHMIKWFSYPLFWQIGFLFTCFVLMFSILAAFRQPLRMWTAIAIIVFHLVNNIFFNVEFYTPLFVLVCLFFPYEKIFKVINKSKVPIKEVRFYGRGTDALYNRKYENGEKDEFVGFYAYRERALDKYPIFGGLLFFPFLDLIMMKYWKIKMTIITALG